MKIEGKEKCMISFTNELELTLQIKGKRCSGQQSVHWTQGTLPR